MCNTTLKTPFRTFRGSNVEFLSPTTSLTLVEFFARLVRL